ncbi:MAG: DUF4236 domain-containing protein [Pseudomonadota bacterium]
MGLRFQKRIRLAPGLFLNVSKRGVSLSYGRPGATVNIGGKGGPRATVGLPGTGVSYTARLPSATPSMQGRGWLKRLAILVLIAFAVAGLWSLGLLP